VESEDIYNQDYSEKKSLGQMIYIQQQKARMAALSPKVNKDY
jgi:hypothetical protein